MTDLEFATCDLEKYSEVYNNPNRRKFSELTFGDPIYCVQVEMRRVLTPIRPLYSGSFQKFELSFNKRELEDPTNPKARKARIYLTERHGFVADKNVSAFVRYKDIRRDVKCVQVYGTSLEECIYKAEKVLDMTNLEEKLVWTQPNI